MKLQTKLPALLIGSLLLALLFTSCDKFPEPLATDAETGLKIIPCAGTDTDSTIFYVSVDGDDKNDGLTENAPFQTIARGLQVVKPGGTVRILPGTYHESLGLQSCGTTENINIEGWNGVPVLDGKHEKSIGIWLDGSSNFHISNLRIINFTDIGIGATASEKITFSNLELEQNGRTPRLITWNLEGYGMHVEHSQSIEIREINAHHNGPLPGQSSIIKLGTGINTFNNQEMTILNCQSHHNFGGGVLVEDAYDVTVEGNEIWENELDATDDGWWDGGIWVDGGSEITLRDNHIHHNNGPGIQLSDEEDQNPVGYVLENNLSEENVYGITIWGFGSTTWPDSTIIQNTQNRFENNEVLDIWISEEKPFIE